MNVGPLDRAFRAIFAIPLIAAAIVAPLPLAARVALGITGLYMALTVFFGTCLGYRLLGVSTCKIPATNR